MLLDDKIEFLSRLNIDIKGTARLHFLSMILTDPLHFQVDVFMAASRIALFLTPHFHEYLSNVCLKIERLPLLRQWLRHRKLALLSGSLRNVFRLSTSTSLPPHLHTGQT